jgi:hypothetical protein
MTSQHLAVVTLHDAAPSFSKRIFEFTDAFENLGINFKLRLFHFFIIRKTFLGFQNS